MIKRLALLLCLGAMTVWAGQSILQSVPGESISLTTGDSVQAETTGVANTGHYYNRVTAKLFFGAILDTNGANAFGGEDSVFGYLYAEWDGTYRVLDAESTTVGFATSTTSDSLTLQTDFNADSLFLAGLHIAIRIADTSSAHDSTMVIPYRWEVLHTFAD